MANSIRENALQKLCLLFAGQQQGQPIADPYDFQWSLVQREPLGDEALRKAHALAILDTDEKFNDQVQCVQARLQVTLEFNALLNSGDHPVESLNNILLNIYRKVRSDPRLTATNGGTALVIDMAVLGNTTNVNTYASRSVEGAVFLELRYKHGINDPRIVA